LLYVGNCSALIRSTYERRSLEISYGIPRWRSRTFHPQGCLHKVWCNRFGSLVHFYIGFSDIMLTIYQTTRCYIPKENSLLDHLHQNGKLHTQYLRILSLEPLLCWGGTPHNHKQTWQTSCGAQAACLAGSCLANPWGKLGNTATKRECSHWPCSPREGFPSVVHQMTLHHSHSIWTDHRDVWNACGHKYPLVEVNKHMCKERAIIFKGESMGSLPPPQKNFWCNINRNLSDKNNFVNGTLYYWIYVT
jgi:hypothetical protein